MKKNLFKLFAVLAIIVSLLMVFSDSLNNDFVEIDDQYFILDNKDVRQFDTQAFFRLLATSSSDYHYVPLGFIFVATIYHVFGPDPYYFHLFSLLLHVVNAILVFFLIHILTQRDFLSLFTAMLFALHPIQVETVSWVAGIKSPLSSVFFLVSLILYIWYKVNRYSISRSKVYMVLALCLLCYILSMLVRPTAVVLPLMMLIIDYYLAKDNSINVFSFVKNNLGNKVPYFLIAGIFLIINIKMVEKAPVTISLPYTFWDHVVIIGHNIWFYLYKSAVPIGLSVYYVLPAKANGLLPSYYYLFAALGYLFVAGATYISCKRKNALFGVLFFFIPLVLVLDNTIFIKDVVILVADRYLYLPAIGLFFLVGLLTESIFVRTAKSAFVLLFALVGILGYISKKQSEVWKNSIALYENTVKYQPCAEFYLRLGREYFEIRNHEKAYKNFKNGFSRLDDNTIFKANYTARITPAKLGLAYGKAGMHDYAKKYFELAIKMEPEESNWWYFLGYACEMLGESSLASYYYQKSEELGPRNSEKISQNLNLWQ